MYNTLFVPIVVLYYIFFNFRSSRTEVFCKKDALRNFAKFTGKHLCQSLTLLKKTLWHSCFPVNFARFLKTPCFTEHIRWLFCNFFKILSIFLKICVSLFRVTCDPQLLYFCVHGWWIILPWYYYNIFFFKKNEVINHIITFSSRMSSQKRSYSIDIVLKVQINTLSNVKNWKKKH